MLENLPSDLPAPDDDGAADHLTGMRLPAVVLPGTDGRDHDLGALAGLVVLYCYPMTGRPDRKLPDGWDAIPGARGCTPQSCAFRDHMAELREWGVDAVFGISTQSTRYQREAAERLHLPFPLLSDAEFELADALALPRLEVEWMVLLRRLTMIVCDGVIEEVFYPVFPPDRNAAEVLAYLATRSSGAPST